MKNQNLEYYDWHEPKNQTHEHFLLKNIARVYLVDRGLTYVGTEIYVPGLDDEISNKKFVDCVGVDKRQEYTYGIEAKVSKSDFNNGYSTRCNYNYIICPDGLIEPNELPDYVGLIYVDLENVVFITNSKEKRIQGLTMVKKSKFHVNDAYWIYEDGVKTDYYSDDMMFAYSQRVVEYINRSNLNELLYHTNYVPKAKYTSGRRRWR
jgi:hypothetical protein